MTLSSRREWAATDRKGPGRRSRGFSLSLGVRYQSFLRNEIPFPSRIDTCPRLDMLTGPALCDTLAPDFEMLRWVFFPIFKVIFRDDPAPDQGGTADEGAGAQ